MDGQSYGAYYPDSTPGGIVVVLVQLFGLL